MTNIKNGIYRGITKKYDVYNTGTRYPTQFLDFKSLSFTIHPTQKSVELLKYLIKTYTNEEMVVLDSTMGVGSTGVACVNLNRNFIGIETNVDYYNAAVKRIQEAVCEI